MITLGIDAYKRTHTIVAVDELGRELGTETTRATTTKDHLAIVRWADQFGSERTWAVEDCRHLSRRLERDMFAAGERIVRVPPKLMAGLHTDRYVPLHPSLIELHQTWRDWAGTDDTGRLISNQGRVLNRFSVARTVAACARIAGIGHVHPHQLRHTLATQSINNA